MYKLSELAALDFTHIYEYTLIHCGESKADEYLDGLEDVFNLLAHSPKIGSECSEYLPNTGRHYHRKHVIYYQTLSNNVFIIRILHQQMEPKVQFV